MSWKSIVRNGCVQFPNKGERIRIEPHMIATNDAFAGMQAKVGVHRQEEIVGVMRHIYGDSIVEPTRIEIHIETETGMEILKLPRGSIPHILVEG